jgi:aspartate/tyrosine/aromatic aminotransferase
MTGVPKAPVDALFGLVDAFNKDPSPKKVSLGIGAYRDNDVRIGFSSIILFAPFHFNYS